MKSKKNHETMVSVEENTNSKKKKFSSQSLILSLIDRAASGILRIIANSFIGEICSSYSKAQTAFSNNSVRVLFHRQTKLRNLLHRFLYWLSAKLDNSLFSQLCKRIQREALELPLNSYGNFFLSFGIYTVLIYVVGWLIPDFPTADITNLVIGISISIVSLPLLFSKLPLSASVKRSAIFRILFIRGFGFSEESFSVSYTKKRPRGNYMLLLGMLCGFLTILISPWQILQLLFSLVFLFMVFAKPETGLLLAKSISNTPPKRIGGIWGS